MSEFIGVVRATSAKQLSSGTFFSICVEDANGDEEWFRSGKKKPPVEKGNRVKFSYKEDKYGKHINLASLKVKEGEAVETDAASKASGKGGGKTDWDAKDKKIGYMAASKQASALVAAALSAELLPIPKSKKPAEKFDLFMEYVKELTEDLFRQYESVPARYEEIINGAEEEKSGDFDTELLDEGEVEDDVEESEDEGDEEDW